MLCVTYISSILENMWANAIASQKWRHDRKRVGVL